MCRWLAYSGSPLYLEELIFQPRHSLIDQSLSAKVSTVTTNGDGFGIGWYADRPEPGVFRDTRPAWNDRNLIDLAHQIRSPLFLAHVRATTGSEVQRSNCHPFRYGRWLFMHNGLIESFERVRRDLVFAIEPEFFPELQGTTDSEVMFLLALGFGLEKEPFPALERMVGLVEDVGRKHGIEFPVQMTLGLSDGERIYAVRYSTMRSSRTLYHSRDVAALERLNPEVDQFGEHACVIVSEPLDDLVEDWEEIAESTAVIVERGEVEEMPFTPRPPG